ncbi:MAG TPA: epoxyqueuosine reductase QueH [Patescibacteria group bacterium]|nr:epoxyqueuosine reductase QueH [Patescibacteria group bacterium]
MKKLLLHVCCGPCAIYVAKKLSESYQVTLFFYNPNIWPEAEYWKRFNEVEKWSLKEGFELIEGRFNQENWFEAVKGLEAEPEAGARCPVCFNFRLAEAARYAADNGFEVLASTLTIGRNKKAEVINPIGKLLAEKYHLEFIEADWKKKGGQEEACRLAKEEDLYRQNYCGCKFSIRK